MKVWSPTISFHQMGQESKNKTVFKLPVEIILVIGQVSM